MLDKIRQRHSADDPDSQSYKDIEELLKTIDTMNIVLDQANLNNQKLRQMVSLSEMDVGKRFSADLETMKQSILRLQARCREAGLPVD